MFASDERVLPVSFDAAASRLAGVISGSFLSKVSGSVYQGGMEYLLRVGPLGPVPGTSRLVRVRFTEPARRDGTMTVGLRWEAAGVSGGLFPALDADIRLYAEGDHTVRVSLAGSYRPPLGALGAGLDRMVLHTVATATIKTLLTRIAAVLENTSAEAADPAAAWQPEPEPLGIPAGETRELPSTEGRPAVTNRA
jgi:hypothetical protein